MLVEVDGQHFDVPDDATPEEIDAISRPVGDATQPRAAPGLVKTLVHRFASGSTMGLVDKAKAAVQAIGSDENDPAATYGDRYRDRRDTIDAETAAEFKEHPIAAPVAELGGGIASSAMLPGVGAESAATKQLPMLSRILTGGAKAGVTGAGFGAASGLINGKHDLTKGDLSGVADDVTGGAEGGAIAGGALGSVSPLVGKLLNGATVSKAAKFLTDRGVPLSVGQKVGGSLNTAETDLARVPFVGEMLGAGAKGERDAAQAAFGGAAAREVVAPGMQPPPAELPVSDQLEHIKKGFDAAYGGVKSAPAVPMVQRGGQTIPLKVAFGQDFADPSVLMDNPADRNAIGEWLLHQADQLQAPGRAPPTTGDLIDLRSNIRSAKWAASKGATPNYPRAQLLSKAEQTVSDALVQQLPPDQAAQLKAIDGQYSKFMTVKDAVARAGDTGPSPFTDGPILSPHQLGAAVKGASTKSGYAMSGGNQAPILRALAQAGKEVFQAPPQNGSALIRALGLPVAAAARFAPRAVMGETLPQRGGQFLMRALRGRAVPVAAEEAGRLNQ